MTDDLDRLKTALKAAPAPDAAARDAALRLAQQAFDRLQESAGDARSSQDRPTGPAGAAGFLDGVRTMLTYLTSRPALAAESEAWMMLSPVCMA